MAENQEELTPEERDGYREEFAKGKGCPHCGGLHLRACPRVRRLVFKRPEEISEVEFWPAGKWPEDNIIWPEDVYADGDDGGEASGVQPGRGDETAREAEKAV